MKPYVAQEIKNRNIEGYREEFPEACRTIVRQHNMDDYLDSADTDEVLSEEGKR